MRAAYLLLLSSVVFLASCGYHIAGQGKKTPGDIRSVYIALFSNGTLEPLLENFTTDSVIERFSRGRALRVVEHSSGAEAILSGRIVRYTTNPVSYAQGDRILEYRSEMTVSTELRRAGTGEVLWKGSASWSEEYPADSDRLRQEDFETAAIRVISERIAQELYFRLVENF